MTLTHEFERPCVQPQGIRGIPTGKEQAVDLKGAEFLDTAYTVSVALCHHGYGNGVAEATRDRLPFNVWAGMEPLAHWHHHDFSSLLAESQHWIEELDVLELMGDDDDHVLAC